MQFSDGYLGAEFQNDIIVIFGNAVFRRRFGREGGVRRGAESQKHIIAIFEESFYGCRR